VARRRSGHDEASAGLPRGAILTPMGTSPPMTTEVGHTHRMDHKTA
jgi:hypothetical protein